MSRPQLPRPARRALHRRQSIARIWLVIGIPITGLSFAHATHAAGALPQGGAYVAGAGTIASQGNGLVITQPGSTRGVIEWNSFSVGRNNSVTFDNGSGATLNRVTGGSPSAILGRLSATGSLYVINPQGIVVGPSGVISTGGRFVASTLDVCDSAFMQGGGSLTLSGNNADASVINLGRISSSGGDVFLIARGAVVNAGTITAPTGTAELAAGEQVLLQDSSSSRQVFVQTGSQGTVLSRGHLKAAQVSLQAADGNVYALAGGGTRIRATGTANRDGHVWLVADGGRVEQDGKIVASNADGSGGTVDTQAAHLTFGKHAAVHAGQWNVLTPAFTIDDTAARALQRSLNAGTSIDVTTTGANGATGDLGLTSSLRWQGPASLTLGAYHNVSVTTGTTIANDGAGNLTLRADASGIDNSGNVTNSGTIDWSKSSGTFSALYDMNGSYTPGSILTNTAWVAAPYSGLVTQVTAYRLVNSLTDLQDISLDLAGNYALGKDLDASATNTSVAFSSLGNATTPFSGQFDGMGHVIDRFFQRDQISSATAAGLFRVIGPTGVVRNLGMTNADLATDTYSPAGIAFGIVAGLNQGVITNAYTSGSRYSGAFEGATLGGLVGRNDGLIERSSSSATLYSAGVLGGLVGTNTGTILQSNASGTVDSGYHGVAGALVGDNSGTVSQSYSTALAYGGASAGGIAYTNSGTIEQSFAAGPVVGYCCSPPGITTSFGAIAAYNAPTAGAGIARNVYWDKETTSRSASAGAGPQLPESNGLTTAQMSDPANFVGWDFGPNGVWVMLPGAIHPVLTWQVAPH
jgi:filamentous hemagglutinin family protein